MTSNSVYLETDLEPDDIFALYLLSKKKQITHIVAGEGDARIKLSRAIKYLSLLNQNAKILIGLSSNKKFDADGKEFNDLKISDEKYDDIKYINFVKDYIKTMIDMSYDPVMIFLKPPRELINNMNQLKPYLKHVKAYMYGGFNFRSVDVEKIPSLFQIFKEVTIYESFHATGSENTLNENTNRTLYKNIMELSNTNEYIKTLLRFTKLWNSNIINDSYYICKELIKDKEITIEQLLTEIDVKDDPRIVIKGYLNDDKYVEQFYRRWKILQNVKNNLDFQFVMADMCAVTVFFDEAFNINKIRASINVDSNRYLIYKNSDSNVYYYSNVSKDLLFEKINYVLK